jgi:hypothetical protein
VNPAVREFADFLYNRVRPELDKLQGIAAEGVLPGVQAGLENLINGPIAPRFASLTRTIAESLGDMFERAGERLNSPFWLKFFDDLEANAVPILEDMEGIIWNLIEGFAGITQAFLDMDEEGGSVAQDFSGGLLGITEDFAEWGRTLKDNPEFQEFIDNVKESWPEIVQGAKDFGEALGDLWTFFEENGDDITAVFTGISDVIEDITNLFDTEQLRAELEEAWETIQGWGENIDEFFTETIPGWWDNMWDSVGVFFDDLYEDISNWFSDTDWGALGMSILEGIVVGLTGFDFAAWEEIWQGIVDWFKDFFGIESPSTLFAEFGGDMLQGLLDGLAGKVEGVLTWFRELPGKIGQALGNLGRFLSDKAASALQWFKDTAVTKATELINWFRDLPGRIGSAIGNLGSLLVQAGRDLIQGLVNGISNAASFVGDVAKSVVNSVIRYVNRHVISGINNLLEFKVAGVTINPPDIARIPLLATGAIVERPTLAVVGEAGREVVLPLSPGMGARRQQLMDEAGLTGGGVSIDARQTYIVRDTQTAEEVGAVVGQRIVRDIRTGVESRYGAAVMVP